MRPHGGGSGKMTCHPCSAPLRKVCGPSEREFHTLWSHLLMCRPGRSQPFCDSHLRTTGDSGDLLAGACEKTCGHSVPGPSLPALSAELRRTFWTTSDLHELGRHDVPSILVALGHSVFQASRKGCATRPRILGSASGGDAVSIVSHCSND